MFIKFEAIAILVKYARCNDSGDTSFQDGNHEVNGEAVRVCRMGTHPTARWPTALAIYEAGQGDRCIAS